MIAFAALDLREGRVVQLVGGNPDDERVSIANPSVVAAEWIDRGFRALHIVDLDAALGSGSNEACVCELLRASTGVLTQVGGGVRTTDHVERLFDAGADRVVVGTRAFEDREWLALIASRWPARIVVAADVIGDNVALRGWKESSAVTAEAYLAQLAPYDLAGVLVTDTNREGRMTGVDAERFRRLAAASAHPLIASGGIANADDLLDLERAGIAAVVLGMALYTGALAMHDIAVACPS